MFSHCPSICLFVHLLCFGFCVLHVSTFFHPVQMKFILLLNGSFTYVPNWHLLVSYELLWHLVKVKKWTNIWLPYNSLSFKDTVLLFILQDVMIELYKRNIWNDAKTVNVITTACFSKVTKVEFLSVLSDSVLTCLSLNMNINTIFIPCLPPPPPPPPPPHKRKKQWGYCECLHLSVCCPSDTLSLP